MGAAIRAAQWEVRSAPIEPDVEHRPGHQIDEQTILTTLGQGAFGTVKHLTL